MTGEIAGTGSSNEELASLLDVGKDGAVLRVHLQPGSSADGVVGVHGAALKVRVRAPATSGRANEAMIVLLARELGVPATELVLTGGASSRDKRVRFSGLSPEELQGRLARELGPCSPTSGPSPP